jgi:hypothetical protein
MAAIPFPSSSKKNGVHAGNVYGSIGESPINQRHFSLETAWSKAFGTDSGQLQTACA